MVPGQGCSPRLLGLDPRSAPHQPPLGHLASAPGARPHLQTAPGRASPWVPHPGAGAERPVGEPARRSCSRPRALSQAAGRWVALPDVQAYASVYGETEQVFSPLVGRRRWLVAQGAVTTAGPFASTSCPPPAPPPGWHTSHSGAWAQRPESDLTGVGAAWAPGETLPVILTHTAAENQGGRPGLRTGPGRPFRGPGARCTSLSPGPALSLRGPAGRRVLRGKAAGRAGLSG